jgi:hypothetical protein
VHAMYMLALAEKESSFSHRVKAPTSSAVGLYQFLEGTWLEVLNEHAAKHGFTAAADAITVIAGRATVTNSENRRWILSPPRGPLSVSPDGRRAGQKDTGSPRPRARR